MKCSFPRPTTPSSNSKVYFQFKGKKNEKEIQRILQQLRKDEDEDLQVQQSEKKKKILND